MKKKVCGHIYLLADKKALNEKCLETYNHYNDIKKKNNITLTPNIEKLIP